MKSKRPFLGLLSLLTLAAVTRGRLFFNQGLLFPCVFFEPKTGKLLMLYELQQSIDIKTVFTLSDGEGQNRTRSFNVTMNFCKFAGDFEKEDLQTNGAIMINENGVPKTYALSYSDGFLNSTVWNIEYNPNLGPAGVITIKGLNDWQGLKTEIINSTFNIYCNQESKNADDFKKSLKLVSFTSGDDGEIVFEGSSKFACGFNAQFLVQWDSRVLMAIYLVIGIGMLGMGYKLLRWSMTVSFFMLGIIIAASEILDNTVLLQWKWISWTLFPLIILGIGFILSYSAFYFPTGAVYLFAIYLGHIGATLITDYYFIEDRFFVGYLLVHAIFLIGSLAIFRTNLSTCKFAFTSFFGAWLIMVAYTNLRYKSKGLYIDSILKPGTTFMLYPFTFIIMVLMAILGFWVQRSFFKARVDAELENQEIDEFMQQQ